METWCLFALSLSVCREVLISHWTWCESELLLSVVKRLCYVVGTISSGRFDCCVLHVLHAPACFLPLHFPGWKPGMGFSHASLLHLLSTAVLRSILGAKTGGGAMPTGCGLHRGWSGGVVKLPAVAGVFLGQGCLVSGDTLGVSIGIGGAGGPRLCLLRFPHAPGPCWYPQSPPVVRPGVGWSRLAGRWSWEQHGGESWS